MSPDLQVPSDEASMKLNRLLVGALFNKKEPQAVGDGHPRADALQRLLSKLQLWTRVERPTDTVSLRYMSLPMSMLHYSFH